MKMMEVTACDACGLLLTIMMMVVRPWWRMGVFWGKVRSGIEGRMVGVRERERRYRGRQCEREPESKEGLVPNRHSAHPSQSANLLGFHFRVLRFPGQSLGQSSSDSLHPPALSCLFPFP